jgi:peptidylprolyl isomerase
MQAELNIEDLVAGAGKAAQRGALISAHYRGWQMAGSLTHHIKTIHRFNVY